ncbi:DUF1833 family protein [Klebsiella aerogenes]|uniref:DUF1833 family protein n=1 Tax=Klebsiella aerogenes TaxID=548 RepID=UPI000735567B|nr:DUF1833 family protein [Klebsiella aerogenes]ELA1945433.1 DUF1833 family protein [Klebsiella aerogenes]KTI99612.1 ArsR family transcriptional regulator [Klebsiella aerogenes]MDU9127178.1 DUF1833 family protein [Klebsiella aerogenes]HBS0233513.1 DUF1833 family protein [Klebsiella aerogenes]HBW5536199.1 DUF1833 family protein [Klebsiella aerogenes]
MTVLNRLYASSGSEFIIETLQINIGSTVHYFCKGYDDITATTENGAVITFSAAAIDIAIPARNSDGTQDLQFAISNINGEVSTAIRDALATQQDGVLTYRQYVSTDLNAPASVPYTLAIKAGSWTALQAQITAGYMNVLDTAWPRFRYTLNEYPGLRYMS